MPTLYPACRGPRRLARPSADETSPRSRWAPIVVDRPIFDFEPNAPSAVTEYRPDTVHDGWSTKSFTIRLGIGPRIFAPLQRRTATR